MKNTKSTQEQHSKISVLTQEITKYVPSVVPLIALPLAPEIPPEILAIFGTAIQNWIDIISKASELSNEEIDFCDIDLDWRANYFDKCRTVHDHDLQILWAKILAGEANKQGTYSKRTVNFVHDMDKRDAKLFTKFCGYVCEMKYDNNTELVPLLKIHVDSPYKMPDEDLHHLDNIGLIRLNESLNEIAFHNSIEVSYYEDNIHLGRSLKPDEESPDDLKRFFTSPVELTQIGKELYPLTGDTNKMAELFQFFITHIWYEFIDQT